MAGPAEADRSNAVHPQPAAHELCGRQSEPGIPAETPRSDECAPALPRYGVHYGPTADRRMGALADEGPPRLRSVCSHPLPTWNGRQLRCTHTHVVQGP